jgi:hypothetical protein
LRVLVPLSAPKYALRAEEPLRSLKETGSCLAESVAIVIGAGLGPPQLPPEEVACPEPAGIARPETALREGAVAGDGVADLTDDDGDDADGATACPGLIRSSSAPASSSNPSPNGCTTMPRKGHAHSSPFCE